MKISRGGPDLPGKDAAFGVFHQRKWTRMRGEQIDIHYLSRLARISLTPAEEKRIGAELGQVLTYIEKLNEVEVDKVEPTAHAVPLTNVSRTDQVTPSLAPEEVLANAPSAVNGLFIVPKIVE